MREGQRFPCGDADHLFHQIDAGDQLGHRMFDLQAGVHFQEVEIARPVDDEFDGAGAGIAHRFRQSAGLVAHRLARGGIKEGRGRFFDDLLVAALDGAFAFVQIDAVAVLVGQHLNFDMARLRHEFLDEDAVIAKAGGGLVLGRLEAFARLVIMPGDAHALAAAARAGLDHHRIADLAGDGDGLFGIRDQAHMARHGGDTGGLRQFFRGDLVAHRLDRGAGRADEDNAGGFQSGGKGAVFGQEAIAGMHGFCPACAHRLHDPVDDDIALRGRRGADVDRLIRHADMQRVAVGVRIDGDGLDPHLARRLDDTAGDFTPVGDQDFLEHGIPCRWKMRR